MGEDGFTEESKDEEKGMRVVGEISERKKKTLSGVRQHLCRRGLCVFSCLICCFETTPSRFSIFFFVFFFSPKPGLRGGDKVVAFQCCKQDYRRFQQNLQAWREREEKKRRMRRGICGGKTGGKRYCKVKVITEADRLRSITQDR